MLLQIKQKKKKKKKKKKIFFFFFLLINKILNDLNIIGHNNIYI